MTDKNEASDMELFAMMIGIFWGLFAWFIAVLKTNLLFKGYSVIGLKMGELSLTGKMLVLPGLISFEISTTFLMLIVKIFWLNDIYILSILFGWFIHLPLSLIFGVGISWFALVVIKALAEMNKK